tara:strand:+ start:1102 stop:1296 length:195 start_codon:yes stop_codon:yes gene_type:complete
VLLLFAFPGRICCWRFSMGREMGNVGNYGKWENIKWQDAHLRDVPEARARASFLTNYNKEDLFA